MNTQALIQWIQETVADSQGHSMSCDEAKRIAFRLESNLQALSTLKALQEAVQQELEDLRCRQ